MIADKIKRYCGDVENRKDIPAWLKARTAAKIIASMSRNFGDEERKPREYWGASSPFYCPRRMMLTRTTEGEPTEERSYRTFFNGDMIEEAMGTLAHLAGVPLAYPSEEHPEQLEVTGTLGGVEVTAHIDYAVKDPSHGLIPIDAKSMSDFGFRKFNAQPEAWVAEEEMGYVAQICVQAELIRQNDLGSGRKAAILGMSKNTGHVGEIWVDVTHARLKPIGEALRIAEEARIDRAMPDRPDWTRVVTRKNVKMPDGTRGNVLEVDQDRKTSPMGWRCGYCPQRFNCWEGFETVVVSNKPQLRRVI